MRTSLPERVRRTVIQHALIGAGDRVVIGVSGGADSTALAHVLPAVAQALGARVAGLAHLNHQLRETADADEAYCREMARKLGLPFVAGREDVAGEARRRRTSIEDAGRSVRYAFLTRAAAEAGATRIAVAHTRDDQAETVLLRLLRGAGPVGMAGIYPRADAIVRPLIEVSRAEVEAWLVAAGLAWRDDPTNRDLSIPRNRVRHELLPWLARHFGAGVTDVLARHAAISREDAEWFERETTEIARRLVLLNEELTAVEIAPLLAVPAALRRRVVLEALRSRAGGRFVGFAQVDAVLALAESRTTGRPERLDLPGQRVERRRGRLIFRAAEPDPGRAGRRRGRPVSKRTQGLREATPAQPGRKNPVEGANLKGHAPKGGRG